MPNKGKSQDEPGRRKVLLSNLTLDFKTLEEELLSSKQTGKSRRLVDLYAKDPMIPIGISPTGRFQFEDSGKVTAKTHRYVLEQELLLGFCAKCSCGWRTSWFENAKGAIESWVWHVETIRGSITQEHATATRKSGEISRSNCSCGWVSLSYRAEERAELHGDIHTYTSDVIRNDNHQMLVRPYSNIIRSSCFCGWIAATDTIDAAIERYHDHFIASGETNGS